jgi:hypothetical protein
MPFCAYWVQISTTFLESVIEAYGAARHDRGGLARALVGKKARSHPTSRRWRLAPIKPRSAAFTASGLPR